MAGSSDGGIWALAGYLYQVVGTLAITARAHSSLPIPSPEDGADADVALELLEVGNAVTAHSEKFGQDAWFVASDETIIAQFKFSRDPANKIGKSELEKIIDGLHAAAKLATTAGHKVTACLIVTNRGFTSDGVQSAEAHWKAQGDVVGGYALRRRLQFSVETAVQQLRELGKEYGAFDDEIRQGIWKLVGRVFTEIGWQEFVGGVFESDLRDAFTGHRDAWKLTVSAVEELSQENLRLFGQSIQVEHWRGDPIRREVLGEIVQKVKERALVCLCGSGGTGKSTLLWQIARHMDGCREIDLARNATHSWVGDVVNRWRNTPTWSGSMNDNDKALKRLTEANPALPRPILLLALDGLDEGIELADQQSAIKRILAWFWKLDQTRHELSVVPATLVVTLRRADDIRRWLGLMFDHPGELPTVVPIDDFSLEEMQSALDSAFAGLDHSAMSSQITPFALTDGELGTLPVGASPAGSPSHPINELVLVSIVGR